MKTEAANDRLVLVTGPSGAGRGTAIKVLEDLGFEAIDNMPLRLIPRLMDGPTIDRPMALGLDFRNRDFTAPALLSVYEKLKTARRDKVSLLFLDCSKEVLLRRFSETRRRHPLTPDDTPEVGIDQEIDLLQSVRDAADIVIDTTSLSPHDLKSVMHNWFADSDQQRLAVSVVSFSYKSGIPRGVDMVFDCRFLQNPHWQPDLRPLTGLDARVRSHLEGDTRLAPFISQMSQMLEFLLPEYEKEGKTHFSIGFGCTGGQHRSVAVAEAMSQALAEIGWRVSIRHRELARKGMPMHSSDGSNTTGRTKG